MPSSRSPGPDWADAPYVRVYLTLARDHPFIWRDATRLGWWLRCLIAADRFFPAPAPLPRGIPDEVRAALVNDGVLIVDEDDDSYRFQGLAAQRAAVVNRGFRGGVARAATGIRDEAGRWRPDAGRTTLDDAGLLNGDAGDPSLDPD